MTKDVMEWVAAQVRRFHLADKSVLDVGSLDVNGTVRPLFTGTYVGLDKRPGPNVEVCFDIEDKRTTNSVTYEVVVSTEMLEHTPRPWCAVQGMANFLERGGPLLLTTRGFGFGRHDYPEDYYRFTPEAVAVLMEDAGLVDVETFEDPGTPGVFAIGWKL